MVLTIAIFAGIGHWIDKKTGTKQPYWTAGLALVGVIGSIVSLIRQLPKE